MKLGIENWELGIEKEKANYRFMRLHKTKRKLNIPCFCVDRCVRFIICLLILNSQFLIPNSSLYAKQYAGTSGAPFLLIDPDARSSAMAGAGVSFLDDAAGLALNPALLGLRDKSQVQALYSERFAGIDYNYLGLAMPIFSRDNIGIHLVNLRAEDTRREGPGITLGNFDVSDLALTTGYSHYFTDNLIGGASLKLIRREIETVNAAGVGLDAGVLYRDVVKGLNFGVSVQNLGTELDFEQQSFNQPVILRLGGSYEMRHLLLAMDFDKSSERSLRMNVGAEVKLGEILRLRGGYKIGNDYSGVDDFTLGFGIKYGGIGFDYAYEQFEELGDVHRFQTSFEWGKVRDPIESKQITVQEARFTPTPAQVAHLENQGGIVVKFRIHHKGTVPILKDGLEPWVAYAVEKIFIAEMEKNRGIAFVPQAGESVLMTELKYLKTGDKLKVVAYVWDSQKPNAILRVEQEGEMGGIFNLVTEVSREAVRKLFGPISLK